MLILILDESSESCVERLVEGHIEYYVCAIICIGNGIPILVARPFGGESEAARASGLHQRM